MSEGMKTYWVTPNFYDTVYASSDAVNMDGFYS